jgi:hypothetical protein
VPHRGAFLYSASARRAASVNHQAHNLIRLPRFNPFCWRAITWRDGLMARPNSRDPIEPMDPANIPENGVRSLDLRR